MPYNLAKQLKDAGFPIQRAPIGGGGITQRGQVVKDDDQYVLPTLEELIEACADKFHQLRRDIDTGEWFAWSAYPTTLEGKGATPTEAVARLYLQLKKGNATIG